MNDFYVPVGNVGAMLPFGQVGALRRPFFGAQNRAGNREMERALKQQQKMFENQQRNQAALAQQAAQQHALAQAYNLNASPGVMPIQSPYAANIPGGNPFAPSPASPPVTPPANARPVPLGAQAAIQMAAITGPGVPGTATFTFTSQDPFWLYDLYIECETQNLAYIESLTLGSQNIRAGNAGIQPATYWSASNYQQGKLQGYFINSTQSLVVVVRNLSTSANWAVGTCSGASVR